MSSSVQVSAKRIGRGAAIKSAAAWEPSLEAQLRIERLMTDMKHLGPDGLRQVRGVEVLETMASAAARKLLQRLAQGEPGARLTREARGALERLRGVQKLR